MMPGVKIVSRMIIFLASGVMLVLAWPWISRAAVLLSDQDAISNTVRAWGVWGPLLVVLLHVVQILVAAIPGHLLFVASGYTMTLSQFVCENC